MPARERQGEDDAAAHALRQAFEAAQAIGRPRLGLDAAVSMSSLGALDAAVPRALADGIRRGAEGGGPEPSLRA